MNKIKVPMYKIFLSCLVVPTTVLFGMQQTVKLHALELINIHLHLHQKQPVLYYVGSSQGALKNIKDGYNKDLIVQSNDVWVPVTYSVPHAWLFDHLPERLPLSLLKKYKTHDTIALILEQAKKLYEVRFYCAMSDQNQPHGFEQLPQFMRDFEERPNFDQKDEALLLHHGIIAPNPAAKEGNLLIPHYIHGPKGFFSTYGQKNKDDQEEAELKEQADDYASLQLDSFGGGISW